MSRSERPEAWGWHLLGLLTPILAATGNVLGGWWVLAGFVFVEVVGPVLDVGLGQTEPAKPPRESGRPFEALLYVHAFLHFVVLATLIHRAGTDGAAWATLGAALSTGLSSGVSGIIVAHEFGHRRPRSFPWWLGRANLLTVLYLHFTTEHNHTHHRLVATRQDPATARRGESLWSFVLRTVPAQLVDAYRLQQAKGRRGWRNPVLRGLGLQVALVAGLMAFGGPWVAGALVFQAAFAVFQLEYINYIRHYGLERGVDERQTERHSWQTEQRWSRWTLLELTRHPAHHMKASLPFWKLRPYDDAPALPSGYYGCFWLAVVPPLWRSTMDGRIPEG
jgi:alkane 1-monooxygenase